MPTASSITTSGANTDRYVPYLGHINTMLNTHDPSNSRWFGMAGAGKCPNELVNHGPVGASCLWQAPSPYRVPKQVNMRRILLTHPHQRTMHSTPKPSNSRWFGIVGAGKCSNERAKHVAVGVGYIWQAPSPYWVLKQVDMLRILVTHPHSRTVHSTHKTFHPSWLGMVGAGKCPKKLTNHGPAYAGCLRQAPSPHQVLIPIDMCRILVT